MSTYNNRNYLIFPIDQLNLVDFTKVHETSSETVRKSVDKTKTFIKWDGNAPEFVSTLTNTSGPYNYTEILGILSTSEWTAPFTGSMP
jgi:hypothetical protein